MMQDECYNPLCSEPVEWPDGINEVYCSRECAKEARSGRAARTVDTDGGDGGV